MLLTITNTQTPAMDISYLLHKHPARLQSFALTFGQAHVFYTDTNDDRCTIALLLDVDPIGLVRKPRGGSGEGGTLEQYVNDRPYVASSFLSVAIARVFGSALGGRSKERPELAEVELPLAARLAVVPCRGGEEFLRRLFEPLGYEIEAVPHALDENFPEWNASRYFTVELRGRVRLRDLLTHLYVLIPVLDDEKHYYVGDDEVEKLLRHGQSWLAAHPEKEAIARRYLKYRRSLADEALARLMNEESAVVATQEARDDEEQAIEKKISLNEERINTVVAALKDCDAKRVLDLGCGEGNLLRALLGDRSFAEIVGMDVSHRALEIASERLRFENLPTQQRERIELIHGSLTYRDKRLEGFDAAAVVEVIEHLDAPRLIAFERVLFEFARPANVILTTPNFEYNVHFENLPAGKFRHRDHRFEWTRSEFQTWANRAAERFGYAVKFLPVGMEEAETGAPTQMAIFARN